MATKFAVDGLARPVVGGHRWDDRPDLPRAKNVLRPDLF